ncbi:MAG: hypothetical protein A2905_00685 [Candidatus Levybacteria bacterium RIFCSPLOWO2_01_FULL_36_10]|nr:MAG: hypothetical protein A2905_00685 [Candidatus Levybacteria bacterium RIFCSPLOWO2_01_FULL_36_10]
MSGAELGSVKYDQVTTKQQEARDKMRTVMEKMREAKDRLGDYYVSLIGEGGEISGMVLVSPWCEPVGRGGNYRRFVVVSEDGGFKAIEFSGAEQTKSLQSALDSGQPLKGTFTMEGQDSKVEIQAGEGAAIIYSSRNASMMGKVVDANESTVTGALDASIKKVQEGPRAQLLRASTTIAIADKVEQALNI